MFFSIDDIIFKIEDIALGTESAELGAWGECKALFTEPYKIYVDALNSSLASYEANRLDSAKCSKAPC